MNHTPSPSPATHGRRRRTPMPPTSPRKPPLHIGYGCLDDRKGATFLPPRPPYLHPQNVEQFSGGNRRGGGEVETSELTHPLLFLLDRIDGSSKLFDQIHAQLLHVGVFHQPLASGRALKCLARLPSPSPDRTAGLFAWLDAPDAFAANNVLRALLVSDSTATSSFRKASYPTTTPSRCSPRRALMLVKMGKCTGRQ